MSDTLRGKSEPLVQRRHESYSPNSGFRRNLVWKTFNSAAAKNLYWQCAAAGMEVDLDSDGGIHTVTARTLIHEGGEIIIDSWGIEINHSQPSELENPIHAVALGSEAAISKKDMFIVAHAYNNGDTLDAAFKSLKGNSDFDTLFPGATAVTNERAMRLLERMKLGQSSYRQSNITLRHTTNISDRSTKNIADFNVDRILTHAQFLSEIGSASLWNYPAPPAIQYALTAFFSDTLPAEIPEFNYFGWLKSGSSRITTARQRVDIITFYELGLWGTETYRLA